MSAPPDRRLFLKSLPAVAATLVARPGIAFAHGVTAKHPAPRPGITAAKVLGKEQLEGDAEAIRIFDQVREIPHIVDGIHCYCGCAEIPDFYSLLSCYESDGMARYCDVCKGEGKLAYELHKAGKTLEQIRAGIDAKFG